MKKPVKKVVKKPLPLPPGPEGSHVPGETAAAAEPSPPVDEEAKSPAPVKKRVVRVVKAKAPPAPSSDATPAGATPSNGATPGGASSLDPLPAADEGLGGSQATPPSPGPLPTSSCTSADAKDEAATLHQGILAHKASSPDSKPPPSAPLSTPPRRPGAAPASQASGSQQELEPDEDEAPPAGPCQEQAIGQQEQPHGGFSEPCPAADGRSPSRAGTAVSEAASEAPASSDSHTYVPTEHAAANQPWEAAHTFLPGSTLPSDHAPVEDARGLTSELGGRHDQTLPPSPPTAPDALSGRGDPPPPEPGSPAPAGGLGGLGELSRAALEALALQLHETAAEGRGQLVKDAEQVSYLQQVGGKGVVTRPQYCSRWREGRLRRVLHQSPW